MNRDFLNTYYEILYDLMLSLPLILLQGAAIIGIVAIVLIFRSKQLVSVSSSRTLGITMGLSSFALSAVMFAWLNLPTKAHLTTDLIFIAAFLGGWRNALWAVSLALLGRFIFGSSENLILAVWDTAFIAIASTLLHNYFISKKNTFINASQSFVIVLWRFLIVEVPLFIVYFVVPSAQVFAERLLVRRAFGSFTFSALIIVTVIMLFKRELLRNQQIYIEPLSGLLNRKALQKDIEERFSPAPYSLRTFIFIDIKNMHDILLELGHDWADNFYYNTSKNLLKLVQQPWLKKLSPLVYSFSDHSFVVVLEGKMRQEIEKQEIPLKIYNSLSASCARSGANVKIWLTLGVFFLSRHNMKNPTHFLRALTVAERSDAPIQYFASSIIRQFHQEKQLHIGIEDWIQNNKVPLWLQPKVSLKDNVCVGAEALLRVWENKRAVNHISPPKVFAIAARHRIMESLEWATIETVVAYLSELPEELEYLTLSVNLSPTTLLQPYFGEKLCALILEKKIEGKRLMLEIIETSRLPASNIEVLKNIKNIVAAGIKISLDDFGTGYSSLSLLARLPFTELKLDYSMISTMNEPRVYDAISLSVTSAKRYNALVVAEGVERTEQKEKLISIGIEHGQGFLFGKAMNLENFIVHAQKHSKKELGLAVS